MASRIIELESFELDELGRVILSDEFIDEIGFNPGVMSAGANGTDCGFTTNGYICDNGGCNYSHNDISCSNTVCTGSTNNQSCH